MKKQFLWVIGLFALAVVIGGAWLLYDHFSDGYSPQALATQPPATESSESAQESTEPQRQAAPDFTVTNSTGMPVQLSDQVGKPVIINFWASWCGPCKAEMPDFDAAYQQYGDRIQFMMVNLTDGSRETVETANTFITEQGYTFPIFYDTESSAAIAYGTYSIPATYFVDAEGYLVAYANGMLSAKNLQQGIDMLLDE